MWDEMIRFIMACAIAVLVMGAATGPPATNGTGNTAQSLFMQESAQTFDNPSPMVPGGACAGVWDTAAMTANNGDMQNTTTTRTNTVAAMSGSGNGRQRSARRLCIRKRSDGRHERPFLDGGRRTIIVGGGRRSGRGVGVTAAVNSAHADTITANANSAAS